MWSQVNIMLLLDMLEYPIERLKGTGQVVKVVLAYSLSP